jgi:hypothetical protein
MVVAGATLYADFTAYGLYTWNGTWTQITPAHPASMEAGL